MNISTFLKMCAKVYPGNLFGFSDICYAHVQMILMQFKSAKLKIHIFRL